MARTGATMLLAVCLVTATASMFWFGYRATREWQHSTTEAAEIRVRNLLSTVAAALERDMKGAQARVLLPFNRAVLNTSLPHDLADRFAGGFARYPYVESFFVCTIAGSGKCTTYAFNRADRPPAWDSSRGEDDPFPVLMRREPREIEPIVEFARAQAPTGARFVAFEYTVRDARYQVVAHLLYSGDVGVRLFATVGFTVNLDWVRKHYFADFIRDIRDIVDDPALVIEITDGRGDVVAATTSGTFEGPAPSRSFPLLFADPVVISRARPTDVIPEWAVRVHVADDAALAAASRGAARTLTLLTVAGMIAIVALVLTVRAGRAAAELATLQSEFVSAVSHEMKTPLSLITLASDTLASGRYGSTQTIKEYGEMLAHEAHELTRLIDNVLCYARLHDSAARSTSEPIDVLDLVEESVNRFRLQCNALGFNVQVQLPIDAPPVQGDRIMLQHAVDNLIDNAVKHGEAGRQLSVKVFAEDGRVHIQVADAGPGIPGAEIPRIFDKFFRGANAKKRGSGLGLAIVYRIVHEHGGKISVRTESGQGTTVDISLPAARGDSAGTAA
jgi:signal transduction histidine kinase